MIVSPQNVLQRILDRREISTSDMADVMRLMERTEPAPILMAALLVGLQAKRRSVNELVAMVNAMREFAPRVQIDEGRYALNIASNGISNAFGVLTATMFVVATTGVQVAMHACNAMPADPRGGDLFEVLGLNRNVSVRTVSESIAATGMGFLSSATQHSVMKRIAPVAHELGASNIFSLLLPLTNPADVRHHMIVVSQKEMIGCQIRVIQQLGAVHALVVHSRDGVHGVSLEGPIAVGELWNDKVLEYELQPEDFGLKRMADSALTGCDLEESAKLLLEALDDSPGGARDRIVLNAAIALFASNAVDSIEAGVVSARRAISSGSAREKVDEFVSFGRRL
ncbi:anthranilate phosphoribosyltransferase [Caballeronia sordidicola]|uniref:anthranilate phosphoribosyltransferase n=1 Tax=Caballeronia sordidicola TaxID=196367 RepID=UPI0004D0242D|nr:anthranilate phosphoribosyltransferase [Caballeronia sordidicola]